MTTLERYGWRGDSAGVARVVGTHGGWLRLVCDEAGGAVLARKKKSAFASRSVSEVSSGFLKRTVRGETGASRIQPTTGDFVKFVHNPGGESTVTEVLPRFSVFERRDPAARRKSQILAVNFDVLFIMMSLNSDFSIPRVERFLSLAETVGKAEVAVVLTKTDLMRQEDTSRIDGLRRAVGAKAEFLAISCLTGEGVEKAAAYAVPGATLALVGSSGVGKSTFVNTLAGEEIAATAEIQEWSGRGRHTTTARELFMLPSGAMVIDTPGVREVGTGDGDGIAFSAKDGCGHRWRMK